MSRDWGKIRGMRVNEPDYNAGKPMGKNQRAVGMQLWDEMIPDGAFVDDPRADAYDRNGEVRRAAGFIPVSRGYEVT